MRITCTRTHQHVVCDTHRDTVCAMRPTPRSGFRRTLTSRERQQQGGRSLRARSFLVKAVSPGRFTAELADLFCAAAFGGACMGALAAAKSHGSTVTVCTCTCIDMYVYVHKHISCKLVLPCSLPVSKHRLNIGTDVRRHVVGSPEHVHRPEQAWASLCASLHMYAI